MTKKNKSLKNKLKQISDLLKFILTLDDEEIMKSTIESVIEIINDEIGE
jgi:hypothetical protein